MVTKGEDVMALCDSQDRGPNREKGVKDDPSKCTFSLDRQIPPLK